MKMLVVDDESFELELNRSLSTAQIIELPGKGRQIGTRAVPDTIRKLVAHDALNGSAAKDVAEAYGVSESSVSAYKNGASSTTTYDKPHKSLGEFVDMTRDKIKNRAQNKLLLALKHMTEDKLQDVKPIELSTIAANMSRVVEKMTPKNEGTTIQNNIVFYSPKQISKDNYETIDVLPDTR